MILEFILPLFLILGPIVIVGFLGALLDPPRIRRGYYSGHSTHGDPIWREDKKTGKFYLIETGEEVQVVRMSLAELLEKIP